MSRCWRNSAYPDRSADEDDRPHRKVPHGHASITPQSINPRHRKSQIREKGEVNRTVQLGEAKRKATRQDVADGKLDIVANIRREALEETGLDIADAAEERRLFACYNNHRVLIFRFYHFDMTASDIINQIYLHIAAEENPEIAGAVAARSADRNAHPLQSVNVPHP